MFTDMVGSTASAQANEVEALKLRNEQARLVRPLFGSHGGREVKSMGDGFLAEFDSALHAVQCAIDIQQHLHERNSQQGAVPIQLRIGVHLGDVEQRETDIFGDAVNIASRIEPLAAPGGVCISGEVFSQIQNKISNKLEKLPAMGLKGLQISIDIYRVILPWTSRGSTGESSGPTGIAVLPFTNMSPDPADLYFADGLTEELITVLSQLRELRVIARTSVMQYKSTTKAVSQIGAELSVSSILEGSVRRSGNRLRITAQLIDARTQGHLWAKSYDREIDEVFLIQTEIAKQVAEALRIELLSAEAARLDSRASVEPESYLAYLRGRALMHETPTRDSIEAGRKQFELAISFDPKNAAAHAGLADALRMRGWWEETARGAEWDQECRRLVARAIEIDPNLPEAHASLGLMHYDDRAWAAAEKEFKVALSLTPSYSLAHHWFGQLLLTQGRAAQGLAEFTLAEGADPLWTVNLNQLALLLTWLGRLDEALVKITKLRELAPDKQETHVAFAFYLRARSDPERCREEFQRSLELEPNPKFQLIISAFMHAIAGEKEQAMALLQQLEASLRQGEYPQFMAWIYAELGDLDACFRWLEGVLDSSGYFTLDIFQLNPDLAHVRADPRFANLLRKANLS
ncbi:MAG: adenylate/guanylate cyclase domain-containing protein [Thermoplasmata archaeon]